MTKTTTIHLDDKDLRLLEAAMARHHKVLEQQRPPQGFTGWRDAELLEKLERAGSLHKLLANECQLLQQAG